MANVVLIEDDLKVQYQVGQFIKELGDDIQLVNYPSNEAFDRIFCAPELLEKPLDDSPWLSDLNAEERTFLLQKELAAEPQTSVTLIFSDDAEIIEQQLAAPHSPAQHLLLGFEFKDLFGVRLAFSSLIPSLFRPRWLQATESLQSKKTAKIRLLLLDISQKLHFVELNLSLADNQKISATIHDVTDEIQKPVLRERELRKMSENKDKELRPFKTIDLILVKPSCVTGPTPQWIEKSFKNFRALNYFPEESSTHFVVLKYEDDGQEPIHFAHPRIDDVIHLPLDRMLFLQKIDILLNLPKKISPRFLFQQPVEEIIEISKRATIEQLSDVGLAILNPVPLKAGTLGNFYLNLPKQKETIHIFGKVLKSEKLADSNHYHVFFGFLGLSRWGVTQIRKYLSAQKGYHGLVKEADPSFQFNRENIFLSDNQKRERIVVVLETNEHDMDQTADLLRQNLDNLCVISESSYLRFLQIYLANSERHAERQKTLRPIALEELPQQGFFMQIHRERKTVTALSPDSSDALFLGYRVNDWIGKDIYLKALFPEDDLLETFDETLKLTHDLKDTSCLLICHDATNACRAVTAKLTVLDDETVKIEFHVPSQKLFEQRMLASRGLKSLDAIIINSAFLPQDLTSFISGLETAATAKNLLIGPNGLNIIVTVDDRHTKNLNLKRFDHPAIRAVVLKPLEAKPLIFSLSHWTGNEYSSFRFGNIQWMPVSLEVQVATDMAIEEISEFGATLVHPRPIAPGAVLFLRRSIFENATHQTVAARFYRCEEHTSKKGCYACSVLYFGITDAFLKFARNYFRETYAANKAKEA